MSPQIEPAKSSTVLRCLIIDDEPLARKGLREYVSEHDFLELVGEFDNPLKAMEVLHSGHIDLLFLDIQMPKLSGLDLLRTLKDPPMTILTTAYSEYAVEGFELEVVDYLVKPIGSERFVKAVWRARDLFELKQSNKAVNTSGQDHFFIKSDNKLVRILFDDLLYAEALQNYVTLHTVSKKYITYLTFRSVEDYLPADRFIRVHKSYIVSASRIDSIEGNDIRIGEHYIPISRNLKEEVMDKLLKGKFLKR
ncbi:MAG: LytTR family DNA-binding domain-containing protein [Chitinophagaceae bacterium]|nr:LytTR family DNA-binding domain-containing protein [Chitinophagaceae bacterium]